MNTGPAAICLSYGFDDKRIQETIAALGMHARLGESAELIRREVIGDKAEEIATACLAKLAGLSDASLLKPGMDASAHKQILVDHLRGFGLNFDAPAYFAEYLSLSKTLACTGFSLHLLHMLHDLLQQVLLDQLHDRFGHDSETTSTLASCISRFTALNLLLTIEGFHQHEIGRLRESLEELRAEAARLYQSASTDQLTGAMSFSHAMKMFDRQIKKAEESRKPLCVMMTDLDLFKRVNDTYGHLVGDIVLKHTAERIKSAVRDFDIVGRFGGEEFVVLLTNTDLGLSKVIAERIRRDIAASPFHAKKFNIDVTISIGVAMLKPGETREALLERADAAMYEAKRTGRNRVVVAEDIGPG